MAKSPFGGFSWLHNQTCAESSLVHTAGADGASSCEVYFVCWRGLNGLDLSTVTGREIKMHQKGETVYDTCFLVLVPCIRHDLLFLQQRAFFCAVDHLVMPAHLVWRFSEAEDSCYLYYVQTNIFLIN